jgi:hypothetical protein
VNFNNAINHLKLWCINKAAVYQKTYGQYGGVTYVGYQTAYELEFKLSTLIDKSFESAEELKQTISDFIDVHYEPSVLNPKNNLAKHIVEKINHEFLKAVEEIVSNNSTMSFADVPYKRVIVGEEAAELRNKFRLVWGYVNTSLWFPLIGDEPKEVTEKFFIMFDYFEPYMKQLEQIIGLPQAHIYSYGENFCRPENCMETVEMIEYGGHETIYTDMNFSWAIYFSHEDTVSFAGSIVPQVKELLSNEKEHWDKFEWDMGKE